MRANEGRGKISCRARGVKGEADCANSLAPTLRKKREDSLFPVKRFFLSGEVQGNLSVLGCQGQLKFGEQAGAIIAGAPAEHAEDGMQHLAGDRDESLQFGFVACD